MGGPGLNATDPFAKSVHGTNAQNLIEKITRNKIYASIFWKESCFGLDAEQLLDKAVALKYVGGSFGGNMVPTSFLPLSCIFLCLCLCLWLLLLLWASASFL